MDKATKVAVEKYPHGKFDGEIGDSMRAACAIGYMQAEKDLALTWQDMAILITIYEQGVDNGDYRRYNEAEWMKEYSQDILRRFIEKRGKRGKE